MHTTSETLKCDMDSSDSLAREVPLVHSCLNQLLALAPWPAAMWEFWRSQSSRYSTFLPAGSYAADAPFAGSLIPVRRPCHALSIDSTKETTKIEPWGGDGPNGPNEGPNITTGQRARRAGRTQQAHGLLSEETHMPDDTSGSLS